MSTGMEKGRQMRFSQPELDMLKAAFRDNEPLLKVLRKIFLPEIDPNAPLGEVIDLWMTVDIRGQAPEQAYLNLLARNSVITHVDQQLMQIRVLAEMDTPSPIQIDERRKKDSSK